MVYTLGCIDIIIKRSALDRNPVKNSEYLIRNNRIEEDFYDQDLICVPGGMNPRDAEDTGKWLEREYNIQIIDESDPGNPVSKDGVVVNGPFGTTTKCNWIRKCGNGWAFVRPIVDRKIQWDAAKWVSELNEASKHLNRSDLHRLREMVFRNTEEIVANGGYVINKKDINIIDPPESVLFDKEILRLKPVNKPILNRIIQAVNEDCLLTARKLAGKNPLVLNMASRRNPGGGVEYGAGAQEECLFRSSNYHRTLYPLRRFYPMDRNYGGIYSPDVTVFRGLESDGYPLLEEPFTASFVAVAALNRPELGPDGNYTPEEKTGMKNKIRTILNIAAKFNHRVLILSAFGCGAFRNPPKQVATLFREILDEPEYSCRFSEIYFSIKPDHNDVSDNCKAFMEVFEN